MSAELLTSNYYAPQSSVIHVVNAEFSGLYSLSDLPRYFQPTTECVEFTRRLIDRAIDRDADVELVLQDTDISDRIDLLGLPGSLSFIIGPKGLEESLDGRPSSHPQSWLWDKGPFGVPANRNYIITEGL